jgi:hypothetical protein
MSQPRFKPEIYKCKLGSLPLELTYPLKNNETTHSSAYSQVLNQISSHMEKLKFYFLIAMTGKDAVFWNVMLCNVTAFYPPSIVVMLLAWLNFDPDDGGSTFYEIFTSVYHTRRRRIPERYTLRKRIAYLRIYQYIRRSQQYYIFNK